METPWKPMGIVISVVSERFPMLGNYYSGFPVVSTHGIYQSHDSFSVPHVRELGNLCGGFHIVSKAWELSISRVLRLSEFGERLKHIYWCFRLDPKLPTCDFHQIYQCRSHCNIFKTNVKQLMLCYYIPFKY